MHRWAMSHLPLLKADLRLWGWRSWRWVEQLAHRRTQVQSLPSSGKWGKTAVQNTGLLLPSSVDCTELDGPVVWQYKTAANVHWAPYFWPKYSTEPGAGFSRRKRANVEHNRHLLFLNAVSVVGNILCLGPSSVLRSSEYSQVGNNRIGTSLCL